MVHSERQHIDAVNSGKRLEYRVGIDACCGIGMTPPRISGIANRPNQRVGQNIPHATPFGQTGLFGSDKAARHAQRQQQKTSNIIILSHKYVIHYKNKIYHGAIKPQRLTPKNADARAKFAGAKIQKKYDIQTIITHSKEAVLPDEIVIKIQKMRIN